jgi:hypothetical protein
VADRQAGWATAWRPGPAKEVFPRVSADMVSRERQHEHCWGGGNVPNEVAVAMTHLSGGSMVRGERRR